jgi:hypothetical protein
VEQSNKRVVHTAAMPARKIHFNGFKSRRSGLTFG